MTSCQKAVKPLTRCLQTSQISASSIRIARPFSTTAAQNEEVQAQASFRAFKPETVSSARGERKLMEQGIKPIGSRRKRAAIRTTDNIPFEQLPYHCFQEARKILAEDRAEKIELIKTERLRIANLEKQDAETIKGGQAMKERRLDSMRKHLEWLKIQADINDPLIKKRFEDGEGDMSKPIYRYLAEKKWRSFQRLVTMQRINQLGVVPDLLPHFEPTAEVKMAFRQRNVTPGEFVDSRVSEVAPRLRVQVFDKGERLVTIVVVDSDIPELTTDNFTSRCHYLAANIPLSPTINSLPLSFATEQQLVHPWLPPFAQKGSPYHRYSVFILEQAPGQTLDVAELQSKAVREGFKLRSFVDKFKVKPVGMHIFRALWDDGTAGVMHRHGIEGANVQFKRFRIPALKPKEKARGWEARHAKPKYNLKSYK